jgi:TetR/AcrR family transcriptional regulator, cholesterol catabolism regulator
MTEIVSRRERKKEETRHRIFHAAIDLFRERGFEQTTVDDITEKADVAKGTFFNYFHRKEAVFAYLSEERLTVIEEKIGALLEEDRSAIEKLIELYVMAASSYEEDAELARFVLHELMRRAYGPNEDLAVRWHAIIQKVVEQGQERGEIRREIPFVRLEGVLGCIFHGTLFEWVHCCNLPDSFALLPELRARLTLVMEGLAS